MEYRLRFVRDFGRIGGDLINPFSGQRHAHPNPVTGRCRKEFSRVDTNMESLKMSLVPPCEAAGEIDRTVAGSSTACGDKNCPDGHRISGASCFHRAGRRCLAARGAAQRPLDRSGGSWRGLD